jgi:hypothetical protein
MYDLKAPISPLLVERNRVQHAAPAIDAKQKIQSQGGVWAGSSGFSCCPGSAAFFAS